MSFESKVIRALATLPHSNLEGAITHSRLLTRLLRKGVTLGCAVRGQEALVASGPDLWHLNLQSGQLTFELRTTHRPLTLTPLAGVAGTEDGVYFGEYLGNQGLQGVAIHHRSSAGVWREAYRFPAGLINHIHALVPDPATARVWILTGDFGPGTGLWWAKNDFSQVEAFAVGNQSFRSTWAYPGEGRLLYGMDSQFQSNAICTLDAGTPEAEPLRLFPLEGSCIYTCRVGDQFVFSTAVEPGLSTGSLIKDMLDRKPGPGIHGELATLVIGDPRHGFRQVAAWEKDHFPLIPFQFGSLSFPQGNNPTDSIYAYGTALKEVDDCLIVFSPSPDRDSSRLAAIPM
jgi:hypothetical protein